MTHEQTDNYEIDRLIHNVMSSDTDLDIPVGLSEKTIRKLEKRVLLRDLLLELSLKLGLVLGSLVVLAGVFLWGNKEIINNIHTLLLSNWQLVASILLLGLITICIDQIGMRFYHTLKRDISI